MSEVSKKVREEEPKKVVRISEWRRRKDAGEQLVQLWLGKEKYAQIKAAANSVEESPTAWIRRAVFSALRKWEIPEDNKNVWGKCRHCRKKHNPMEHGEGWE